MRVKTQQGPRILAHGRDPNFPGWPDTLQLDYTNPDLQNAKLDELLAVAGKCNGVRYDMAMLLLPDIFQRTWGVTPQPFWPTATATVRRAHPGFTFMAEVYWDLEWTLQQQGFDYCYDKRLYDRLQAGNAARTTTNPARRPPSRGRSTELPRRSRSCRRACASSNRARWTEHAYASRRICVVAPSNPPTGKSPTSTTGCCVS